MAKRDRDDFGPLRAITSAARQASGKKKHAVGWEAILSALIKEKVYEAADGNGTVSYATVDDRIKRIYKFFRILTVDLKYGIEDPANIKPKHIKAFVKHLREQGRSNGTIQNYMTSLRLLAKWTGKKGMVKETKHYAAGCSRKLSAQKDKSFEGNNVDFWEIYDRVVEKDKYVAMQLLLIKAFGLRRKEAVMFKPYIAHKESYIEVFDGSKGKRPRTVPVNDDFKRMVLEQCKNFLSVNQKPVKSHMGNPNRSLKQNLDRYSNVLRMVGITKAQLGVTGHGLRAEYAMNQLKARGVSIPLHGGDGKAETDLKTQWARHQVSEELGHSRTSIITAYSGPLNLKNITSTPGKINMPDSSTPEDKSDQPDKEQCQCEGKNVHHASILLSLARRPGS